MNIIPTRLDTLIKQALTPRGLPSPKADPTSAALIKALVQPPVPTTGQSAHIAARLLQDAQPRQAGQPSQRLSSLEIEDAYRAVMEPDLATDDTPVRPLAGRAPADADQAQRGLAPPPAAVADNTSRPAFAPALSAFLPAAASTSALVAANANASQSRGTPASPAGHAPRSVPAPISPWTVPVVAAIVTALGAMIVVLLLR